MSETVDFSKEADDARLALAKVQQEGNPDECLGCGAALSARWRASHRRSILPQKLFCR